MASTSHNHMYHWVKFIAQTEFTFEFIITLLKEWFAVIMFSDWLTQAVFNDDERDTTEVPKQALNVVLDYLFISLLRCQACI